MSAQSANTNRSILMSSPQSGCLDPVQGQRLLAAGRGLAGRFLFLWHCRP
jgi:hypothetical protein